MTIGFLLSELQKLGVSRFCFRIKDDKYVAMISNEDGDIFGVEEDTVDEAASSLISALQTKNLLGSDGWKEFMNPKLN